MHQIVANKKQITIQLELDEVDSVHMDPNRIKQVVDNLISNAIKFSQPHSQIKISLSQNAHKIIFAVIDSGPGIAEAEQKQVFLPFQTVSNKPTAGEYSSGLGLAICKSIIEAHQGKIGLQSEVGRGSRFFFQLSIE